MRRYEIPTWLVVVAVYAAWLALTHFAGAIPLPVLIALGGLVIAWHGSLQHETIHGHPTRSRAVNAVLGTPPLGLWLPYGVYRETHIAHHRTDQIADPGADPESFYVTANQYRTAGPVRRAVLWAHQTLFGRMILGPPIAIASAWGSELSRVARGELDHVRHWLVHAAACFAVLYWVIGVCDIPLWRYAAAFVSPGLALTLLRSYAEHQPASEAEHRTAIVEAGGLMSLVFLNNNLHVVHHDDPTLPWYEYRRRYATERESILRRNGGKVYPGYGTLAARYAVVPKDPPIHGGQW